MEPLRRADSALCARKRSDLALWPNTSFVRGLEEIAALKQQPGKHIDLMGGARITASLIDAGLVDELRFIIHSVIAGAGKALFATAERRHGLELRKVQQLQGGRVSLIDGILLNESVE